MKFFSLKSIYFVGLAVAALTLLTVCEEANMAVDSHSRQAFAGVVSGSSGSSVRDSGS